MRPHLNYTHKHRHAHTHRERDTHTILLFKLNFKRILGILPVFGIGMGILLMVLLCFMNNSIPQLSPEAMELPWVVSALIQK